MAKFGQSGTLIAGTAVVNAATLPLEIAELIRSNLPVLEDEVTVEVVGQPGANKQQLYFLALAAANGMVRRAGNSLVSIAGSYGMLMIEYDAANDWVRCTIRYKWGMASVGVVSTAALGAAAGVGSFLGIEGINGRFSLDQLAVYRGPQCNVVGGKFDFVASTNVGGTEIPVPLPGVPSSSFDPNSPVLPFAGSPILTSCSTTLEPSPTEVTQLPPTPYPPKSGLRTIQSPNPKPPGDNRSRGTTFVTEAERVAASSGTTIAPGANMPAQNADPKKCCEKLSVLIPMVTAALSAPATNSVMAFVPPVLGPTGR